MPALTEAFSEAISPNMGIELTVIYSYKVAGRGYDGKVSTLMKPHTGQVPGRGVYVLYEREEPELSTIYPHPYGYHRA